MKDVYFGLGLLVGLMVMIEGVIYLRGNVSNRLAYAILISSGFEFVWAIVTIFALIYIDFSAIEIYAPLLYISYNIVGWLVGLFTASKERMQSEGNAIASIDWLLYIGVVVGLCYASMSAYFLFLRIV